jgi:hypothetical protein
MKARGNKTSHNDFRKPSSLVVSTHDNNSFEIFKEFIFQYCNKLNCGLILSIFKILEINLPGSVLEEDSLSFQMHEELTTTEVL